jgi:hypothetical protein
VALVVWVGCVVVELVVVRVVSVTVSGPASVPVQPATDASVAMNARRFIPVRSVRP